MWCAARPRRSCPRFSGYYLLKCLESMGDVSQLPAFSTALKSLFLKNWKGYGFILRLPFRFKRILLVLFSFRCNFLP